MPPKKPADESAAAAAENEAVAEADFSLAGRVQELEEAVERIRDFIASNFSKNV